MTGLAIIPLEAIDPAAHTRNWRREFEWHLDQIPPLMETMGMLGITTVRASRTDQVKVSGGGYIDNVPVTDGGVAIDAQLLWAMLVDYLKAATAWINHTITPPHAPILPPLAQHARDWAAPRANGDPLTARRLAFETIAWLIDHADSIQPITELDDYREELFAEIRRARSRYRSAGTRRRAKPRLCGICGECAVIVDWMTPPNGSPKPVQVGKCTICGQIYTDTTDENANHADGSRDA